MSLHHRCHENNPSCSYRSHAQPNTFVQNWTQLQKVANAGQGRWAGHIISILYISWETMTMFAANSVGTRRRDTQWTRWLDQEQYLRRIENARPYWPWPWNELTGEMLWERLNFIFMECNDARMTNVSSTRWKYITQRCPMRLEDRVPKYHYRFAPILEDDRSELCRDRTILIESERLWYVNFDES